MALLLIILPKIKTMVDTLDFESLELNFVDDSDTAAAGASSLAPPLSASSTASFTAAASVTAAEVEKGSSTSVSVI